MIHVYTCWNYEDIFNLWECREIKLSCNHKILMSRRRYRPIVVINETPTPIPRRRKVNCPAGQNGIAGVTGPFGATGSTGIVGFTGMSGGSSSTGESGVTGNVGLTGPRGEIGFCCPGTRGATGFTGQFGVQGPELTGPQGNIGPCCNTLTGPAGMSGPNGVYCVGCTTPIFVGNTVYVDAVFGNDTTGQRERFDLPFATLAGASGVTQAGDLIIVRPGTYTPSAQLPNIGFNWYFEEGAIVINASTSIFGPGSYDISGFGYLNVILTRDNGNVTANYVQRLNVNTMYPAYVVTVNVKLMNRIVVTEADFKGQSMN